MLDTGPLTGYLRGRPTITALVEPWRRRRETATSVLVYAEIVEYLKGLPDFPTHRRQFHRLLRDLYPYFLTFPILERYADIRRDLRPPHGPGLIGDVDTLIAATALEEGLTLVTSDSDFERVPGLSVIRIDL